ncbi:hypothetical protein J1N51_09930 [Psychrosphaera ytuae]|uniref:Uncharacterized protein n=1 Tax=Psychrosphaera ytuae TaxID=2820710 RepID=A0A975HHD4_9GAMM|nr:hypothetical protein [Psychrosphaera ytuae]QTH63061.1 hypothetical protein J1N51_09930 [Psychrosphaera ytuae]
MRGLKELFQEAANEFYQLTHLGVSQFDMDAEQLKSDIDLDLFGEESRHLLETKKKKLGRDYTT